MVIELKELLEYLVSVAKQRDEALEEIGHLRSSLASAQQRLLMVQREQAERDR